MLIRKKDEQGLYYGWIIVIASFFAVSTTGFISSFGVFYEPLINDFNWTVAQISLAPSIRSFIYIIFVLPSSLLYEKINARPTLLLGGTLMGLGLALSSQAKSLWQLYFFYGVVGGIGNCSLWVPLTSTIAKWFEENRGFAMGTALSGFGFGALVIAPFLGKTIITHGWRTALLFSGIVTFVVITVTGILLREKPVKKDQKNEEASKVQLSFRNQIKNIFSICKKVLRRPEFWLLFNLWIFSTVVRSIYFQHIVLFSIKIDIPSVNAALALGIMGATSIIGRIITGFIMDRIGSSRSLIFCYVINLFSTLILIFTETEFFLYLFAVLFGFSYGGRTTLEVPLTMDFFDLKNIAIILGMFEIAFGIGGFIGPYLAGYVYDILGRYNEIFLFCSFITIISLIITILLNKKSNTNLKSKPTIYL
jgi:OFA family oxalate/formate antiporter-like MFS transporter